MALVCVGDAEQCLYLLEKYLLKGEGDSEPQGSLHYQAELHRLKGLAILSEIARTSKTVV